MPANAHGKTEPEQGLTDQDVIGRVRTKTEARNAGGDSDHQMEKLAPVENFPHGFSWFEEINPRNDPRKPGKESRALRTVIAQSCNGWRVKPTAAEGETAIKNRKANWLGAAMASTVICEGDLHLIVKGEREEAWSLQDLAWWIHELKVPCTELIHWLNVMSKEYMHRKNKDRRQ